jgi:anaerobic magnesium-protoporphyrin IX monomethyl ester cyclase
MQKILLINPHETEQSGFTNPPLGLLYIAGSLLKQGYHVQLVDGCLKGKEAIDKSIREISPDIVGITCLTPGRKRSLEVARMVKDFDPTIKVVLGGAHATIMHKQLMENYPCIDYIVLGEGEITFLEIAQGKECSEINGIVYREKGKIIKNHPREYIQDLDDLPFPAWHLVDLKKYPARGEGIVNGINLWREPRISVIFSRGCKGHCDFCSTWWIWRGWRRRSPRNMVDEIEFLFHQHGVRHFCFADDAMTVDREATIGLCDEIIKRKISVAFSVTTRTDCVDEQVLQKLKEAGCYEIAFGIETGSPVLLQNMGKENDLETSERAILMCKKVGIKATALMIIGNIGETEETIRDSILFLRRTDPDEIGCVEGLWVLPGTKVYNHSKSTGFIDDDFWLTDEPYKVYTREHSLEELKNMQKRVVNYSFKARLRRIKKIVRMRFFPFL